MALYDDEDERDAEDEALSLAALHPATAALPQRDAPPAPTLRELDAPASDGFDENGMGPITIEPSNEPDPLAEAPTRDHLGEPDPSSGSVFGPDDPSEDDYGSTLARDDAEPLGSIGHDYGANPGQMVAPSGADETPGERFSRLEVGGDFAPVLPAGPAEPGRALAAPMGDEPEAVDNAAEEADEAASGDPEAMALAGTAPAGDEPEAVHNASEEAAEDPETHALMDKPPRDEAREAAAGPLRTLDEGLPSERDIADARDDVGESILHRIANALRGATGQPLRDYNARGDALQQQRSTGMERRQAAKGAQRSAEATALRAEARRATTDAQAERGLAIRQQQADAATRASETRGGLVEAQTERTRAQTASEQLETAFSRATREERQSAESGLSRGYQEAVRLRAELTNIDPPENLEGQTAEQLEPVLRAMSQGVGVRRGRGGTGGRVDRATLEAAARDLRIPASTIAASSDRDLASLVRSEGGQAADDAREDDGGDTDRVMVWSNAEGGPITADPHMFDSSVEMRNYRNGIASAGDISGHLAEIERVYTAATGGDDDPIARAQAFAQLSTSGALDEPINLLLGALTEMARTGVINPGPEAERLRSMVPDPGSVRQMAFGQFQQRMTQFRRSVRDSIARRARQVGVSDTDVPRIMREIGLAGSRGAARARPTSPRPAAPAAPAEDFSQMTDEQLRAIAEGD